MAEKIARLGLERERGVTYYLKDGDVWAKRRGGMRGRRLAKLGLEMDYARYLYFIDSDGDLAREPRATRSAKKKAGRPEEEPASAQGTQAEPLLAFSWGYYGWGNHTRELVEMVDRVEAERGYAPPLFVDIRIRRAVRALGFRERAFEELLGPERYVWMQGLGNLAVADHSIGEMTIADPSAASELLDRIVTAASQRRRVIFFCACKSPLERHACHRGEVVQLLVKAARRRKVPLAVQEWPGGAPGVTGVEVGPDELRKLLAAARSDEPESVRLAIPASLPLVTAMSLPHLSVLRCTHGDDAVLAVTSAAVCTPRGWVLPVHAAFPSSHPLRDLERELDADLEELELGPFGARLALPERWRSLV